MTDIFNKKRVEELEDKLLKKSNKIFDIGLEIYSLGSEGDLTLQDKVKEIRKFFRGKGDLDEIDARKYIMASFNEYVDAYRFIAALLVHEKWNAVKKGRIQDKVSDDLCAGCIGNWGDFWGCNLDIMEINSNGREITIEYSVNTNNCPVHLFCLYLHEYATDDWRINREDIDLDLSWYHVQKEAKAIGFSLKNFRK